MPQFAIPFSGVKKVPANSLLGNSTGAAASASGLSASDARTLLGLATSDSPTFGGLNVEGVAYVKSSGGAVRWSLDGNSNLISQNATGGPRLGSTVPYSFVGDTSTGFDTDGSGTLVWIANANVVEQRNGVNGQQLSIFNTFTDSSNYERVSFKWNSNVFEIASENDGTGTQREIDVKTRHRLRVQNISAQTLDIYGNGTVIASHGPNIKGQTNRQFRCQDTVSQTTGQSSINLSFNTSFTGASQNQVNIESTPIYNQTGTSGSTDFKINRTETALGSGDHNFADFQVGGTSKFSVGNDGRTYLPSGSAAAPSLTFTGNANRRIGIYEAVADSALGFVTGGGARFAIRTRSIAATSTGSYNWTNSSGNPYSATIDTSIFRDDAGKIAQRNGANAQQLSIFNTWTDSSNNEGFKIDWQTLTNYCLLETFANGTGVAREMRLQAGAGRFYLKASGSTYAVVTDGSGNEKYDFIDGVFSSRTGASLGTSSSPWGSIYGSNLYNTTGGGRIQLGASDTIFYQSVRVQADSDYLGWSNSGRLYGGGTGIIEQYGGTTAQQLNIYNTRTDSSNFERGFIRWDTNVFLIGSEASGTGTARTVKFQRGGSDRISFPANSSVTLHSNVYPHSNGANRLGFSTLRWSNVHTQEIDASSTVTMSGLPTSDPGTAGQLWNDSGTVKISSGGGIP